MTEGEEQPKKRRYFVIIGIIIIILAFLLPFLFLFTGFPGFDHREYIKEYSNDSELQAINVAENIDYSQYINETDFSRKWIDIFEEYNETYKHSGLFSRTKLIYKANATHIDNFIINAYGAGTDYYNYYGYNISTNINWSFHGHNCVMFTDAGMLANAMEGMRPLLNYTESYSGAYLIELNIDYDRYFNGMNGSMDKIILYVILDNNYNFKFAVGTESFAVA
jgi:hypothetical protein